jgi:hypothetical protein
MSGNFTLVALAAGIPGPRLPTRCTGCSSVRRENKAVELNRVSTDGHPIAAQLGSKDNIDVHAISNCRNTLHVTPVELSASPCISCNTLYDRRLFSFGIIFASELAERKPL